MRLLIIRHGDPCYDPEGLTERGKKEAEILSQRLAEKENIDYFYVSSYNRARQTAEPALEKFHAQAQVCDWLHEFDYQVTWEDGTKRYVSWDLMPSVWTRQEVYFDKDHWWETSVMKSGNIKEEYDKVIHAFDELLAKHGYVRDGYCYRAEHANKDTIALFCHFGVECVLLSHLMNISPVPLWQGLIATPSSVTSVCTEEREKGIAYFRVNAFSDSSHLTQAGEEVSFAGRFCEIYDDFSQRH